METVNCTQCGTAVARKPYHAAMTKNPFCGFKCYAEWQKVHRKGVGSKKIAVDCTSCGSTMVRHPSAVSERNFCSRECSLAWRSVVYAGAGNPAWRGGHPSYRGENWYPQRDAARLRDANTCQHCGRQGDNLPVHHLRPFCLYDHYLEANRLENLLTLCPRCHGKAEALFWAENPTLVSSIRTPDCLARKVCLDCGMAYQPRSAAARRCDHCSTRECRGCGQSFYSRRSPPRPFCSDACYQNHHRLQPKPCAGCGEPWVPHTASRRFCSQRCRMIHSPPRRKSSPRA